LRFFQLNQEIYSRGVCRFFIYLVIIRQKWGLVKTPCASFLSGLKVQVSISYTPEGTDTVHIRLNEDVRIANSKEHEASESSSGLSTTPEVSGGEFIRNITVSN
jgi:hypothetical protein